MKLNYSKEMMEQDKLWEAEKEDLTIMMRLQNDISKEAKSNGFKGEILIYDGPGEVVSEVFRNQDELERTQLGELDFDGQNMAGNCRGLIKNIIAYHEKMESEKTMTNFITSDWHFGHQNICGPEGFVPGRREIPDTKTMDEQIIKNFNRVVKSKDHTYHLGDLSLNQKPVVMHEIFQQLNGSFSIVRGNHDGTKLIKYLERNNYQLPDGRWKYTFEDVGIRLKANKRVYYLTHFPLGMGEHRKIYRNLCGHIHEYAAREANVLNVGIDSPEIGSRPFGEPLELGYAMQLVDEKWQSFYEKTKRDLLI